MKIPGSWSWIDGARLCTSSLVYWPDLLFVCNFWPHVIFHEWVCLRVDSAFGKIAPWSSRWFEKPECIATETQGTKMYATKTQTTEMHLTRRHKMIKFNQYKNFVVLNIPNFAWIIYTSKIVTLFHIKLTKIFAVYLFQILSKNLFFHPNFGATLYKIFENEKKLMISILYTTFHQQTYWYFLR